MFDRAIRAADHGTRKGELVDIVWREKVIAVGVADPGAPIAVRILDTDPRASIDDAWVRTRARRAGLLRAGHPLLEGVEALRLIHGENDGLPGLVIDRYGDVGVVVYDGAGCARLWRDVMPQVLLGLDDAGFDLKHVWCRTDKRVLRGDPPPECFEVSEHGARYEVDVRRGHKTGLFLDQRENRRRVGELARQRSVLNLFGYTGGFSIHAALGGAGRTITVDSARPAIDAAKRNFALSGIDLRGHELVCADVFDILDRYRKRGRSFGMVICDPPSFAPSRRTRDKGLVAYRTLNHKALRVVAPDGLLVTASCSSHVTGPDLLHCVAEAAALAKRTVRIVERRSAGADHPERPEFPEGHYLDLLVAHVQ